MLAAVWAVLVGALMLSADTDERAADDQSTPKLGAAETTEEGSSAGELSEAEAVARFDAFPKAAPKTIRKRAVSPGVAAQLAARMPQFEEPKPAAPPPAEDAAADLRDGDRPQNQILRLPDYVVREKKPAVLRDDDIYSAEGRAQLAMQRYLSEASLALNRYQLPLVGGGATSYAMMRYHEDERLRHIGELNDTARDIGLLGQIAEGEVAPESAGELRRLIRDTYSGQRSDSYNGYRRQD